VIVRCGNDNALGEWVASQIEHMPSGFKDFTALGVYEESDLIAAVVYHEFRGNDIQMSVAASKKRWMSKRVLAALFAYPFDQIRCDRVTAMTPKNAASTRRFLLGVGFKEEGNLRRGFLRDDCIVYGMLREECRWLREKNG
jgi:RimJ/RimL family protein N-acetyltransferase